MVFPDYKEFRKVQEEYNDLQGRRQSLLSLKVKLLDGMPKAQSKSDITGRTVVRLVELEEEIERLADLINTVEDAIERLDGREKTIMRLRYYDGLKFREIAHKMHYDTTYIYKLYKGIKEKLREARS